MIRPKKIKKVTIFGHNKDKEKIFTSLFKMGVVQLKELKDDIMLEKSLPDDQVKLLSEMLLRVTRLNHIMKLAPAKEKFLQKLYGLETTKKHKEKRKKLADVEKDSKKFLLRCEEDLIGLEEKHSRCMEEIKKLQANKKIVEVLDEHKLPLDIFDEMKKTQVVAGGIGGQNISKLRKHAKEELKEYCHIKDYELSKKESMVVVLCLKEDAQKLNFILKKFGVNIMKVDIEGIDKEHPMKWIENGIKTQEQEAEKLIRQIGKIRRENFDESVFLREELELANEKFEVVHKIKESKSFFVLQGYIVKEDIKKLKQITEAIIVESVKDDDNVPVKLSNPKWLKPFEMLTELYSLPKYKDLDPTFVVGPLFLIYAGFMLTDFVYGLGLAALGAAIYWLFRKQPGGTKDMSISIIGIGVVSMFFGVLTGSYLGDAPKYFFGLPVAQLAVWKDPLADPLYFLIISLFVGLLHLNIGLILGLVEDIRKKAWKEMLSSRVVWWLLQISILAFVLKMPTAGKILISATVLMVIVLQGPLGLLGMTGFMGDVISYSRLFALALSTAGIAMTVNLLMDMLAGVPYVGFLLAAIIFIIGHLFSFLMNSLGSFVHSIRLQFVEFFGKFYEGGGDRFKPFKEERVYTEVQDE